jgi:hypothetical protein
MSISCPECGGDVPAERRTIAVLAGACSNCSREVVLLSPGSTPLAAVPLPSAPAAPAEAPSAGVAIPHPGDDDCDGTLTLEVAAPNRLVGVCTDCGEEFVFQLAGDADEEAEAPAAPMARPRRPPMRDMGERGGPRMANARPCRQCGGPLSFETGEDGTVTGHCASCGNTFSLAPRRDSGPGRFSDRRGGGGGGGGGFDRRRSGGGGGWRPRPSGRFDRRGGDSDRDDRPRRRFRRRDE